jgi:hypothetical protein
MIESPVLDGFAKYVEQLTFQKAILFVLKDRFGAVPADLDARVRAIQEEELLLRLITAAGTCADLDVFRVQLPM